MAGPAAMLFVYMRGFAVAPGYTARAPLAGVAAGPGKQLGDMTMYLSKLRNIYEDLNAKKEKNICERRGTNKAD